MQVQTKPPARKLQSKPEIIDYVVYTRLGAFTAQYRSVEDAQARLKQVPGGYIKSVRMADYVDLRPTIAFLNK